jgi:hypothetical protein
VSSFWVSGARRDVLARSLAGEEANEAKDCRGCARSVNPRSFHSARGVAFVH